MIGVCLLVSFFVGGVILHDRIKNAYLERNARKIYVGMAESELLSLMGKPTCQTFSDIGPSQYWTYGVDSFTDNPVSCGPILIRMSPEPRVVQEVFR